MKKNLRIGIIGTGDISNRHMNVWSHVPEVTIAAAADINEPRLKAWGEKYHMNEKDLYTDFREMLKRDDLDAIDVCVHNNLHAPVSMYVMKAGYPCYSEKPMTSTYYDSKLLYDCSKITGQKLAIQISSLFSGQTYIAKKLIEDGKLGEIYHAHSVNCSRRRRPVVDRAASFCSPAFQDTAMAGHGVIVDLGIYYLGQMLFLLGLPEVDYVAGDIYQKIPVPAGRHMGVEDMGVGYVRFKNGLTLDIMQASASNVEEPEIGSITGSRGGLVYTGVDSNGGEWSRPAGAPRMMLPAHMQPTLKYTGEGDYGLDVEINFKPNDNMQDIIYQDPEMRMWFDNQYHWYNYLCGNLTDETRYDTPLIGLNHSLVAEGMVLASEYGRPFTADEIKAQSKSLAIWKQETPWGIFDYEASL